MKENNNTPLVWNNIPEWAIFALEYGIEEELFLTDEDKDLITRFIGVKLLLFLIIHLSL